MAMYGVVGPGRWERKAVGRFAAAAAAAANSDVSSTLLCDFRGARAGVGEKLCGVAKLRNRLPGSAPTRGAGRNLWRRESERLWYAVEPFGLNCFGLKKKMELQLISCENLSFFFFSF